MMRGDTDLVSLPVGGALSFVVVDPADAPAFRPVDGTDDCADGRPAAGGVCARPLEPRAAPSSVEDR
jgi:hypothetical protein